MRYHIDVLGRLHGVWGLFGILTGSSLFVLALGCWASLATLAPVMAAGGGVRRHRQSGRVLAIGLSLPNLVLVPFGTALGVYALWVLLNDDARCAFGRPPHLASSVPTSMEEDL